MNASSAEPGNWESVPAYAERFCAGSSGLVTIASDIAVLTTKPVFCSIERAPFAMPRRSGGTPDMIEWPAIGP